MTAYLEKGTQKWCVSLSSDKHKITLESLEFHQNGSRFAQAARLQRWLECWTCERVTHWWCDCPNAGDSGCETRTSQAQNTRRCSRSDYVSAKELDSTALTSKSFLRLSRRTETAQARVELPESLPRGGTSLLKGGQTRGRARALSEANPRKETHRSLIDLRDLTPTNEQREQFGRKAD
ncbi:hypothetical protein TSAR_012117 [Trichomalopsis sarcophagae]|uniref:Uncharacterized protein n=1 Tax=Trichomalopsis sarcophagae TaxID=543379 RepID=A0A232F7H4_9HYME|nr:hypothetical protein TSAR_012117 [Trichomalopsis sarcophagae]